MARASNNSLGRLSLSTVAACVALVFTPLLVPAGTPLLGAGEAKAGHRHHHHDGFDAGAAAVIGGIIGLGLGLSVGEARYYDGPYYRYRPRPLYRVYPEVRYYGGPHPWTGAWYRYCAAKYRSFDARSGTFQPNHGRRRLCR
ncbi:BA14K family protein [Jiella sonneratiae]|uniref:Lectin-like protein BA14k n=1 Tax=Jiella sonneratiae TaxID=2816856 RepID=A0ABS3J103_9HYPH|nr:BA14K family protein [Jiella sonneratiae]MBO0902246.1 BA14K family protein [Jiella sonneratiae]